jgi:mono/diheme cytochrome c family protein
MKHRILMAGLCTTLAAVVLQVHAADADKPAGGNQLYTVVDGDKVDPKTLAGWKTWRAMACERCHGKNQEGMVGPSLVESLKTLTKEEFKTTVMNGRVEKGMPNFSGSQTVQDNIDNLYAYLKGRSDGAIKPGHLHPIE